MCVVKLYSQPAPFVTSCLDQVSRRLMRRIKATLLRPGDNLGYVKVAVHAYIYLLARSTDEVSSYSPGFFAREVVSGPDAVVSDAHSAADTEKLGVRCVHVHAS
jgi:hypothetical protein